MKEKYIVTGGAGLIGSNLIRELNSMGISGILVVDHLGTTEKWKNLRGLEFLDYMEKDVFLESILKDNNPYREFKYLVHLGACSSTTETDASYLIENNYRYTQILGNFALSKGIRFVYASSAATYGLGEKGYCESNLSEITPLNMYGYSKHLYDLYALKNQFLNRITGLKYFNVFGYGEFHKGNMQSVVLKGYKQIQTTGSLELFQSHREDFKDGEQKRDFLYVKDAAKITIHLLHTESYGLFNVGRGLAETWNDLGSSLFLAMKVPKRIQYIPMPDHLKEKYQYYTKADIDKLQSTGYKEPFWTLENAVSDYVTQLNNQI